MSGARIQLLRLTAVVNKKPLRQILRTLKMDNGPFRMINVLKGRKLSNGIQNGDFFLPHPNILLKKKNLYATGNNSTQQEPYFVASLSVSSV